MPVTWACLGDWEKHDCASVSHLVLADWRMECGGHGSYYCDECKRKIEDERIASGKSAKSLDSSTDRAG
jgi:hypothetical protein